MKPLFMPPSRFALNRHCKRGMRWIFPPSRTSYFNLLIKRGMHAGMENCGASADPQPDAAARESTSIEHGSDGGSHRDAGKSGNADAPPIFAVGRDLYSNVAAGSETRARPRG